MSRSIVRSLLPVVSIAAVAAAAASCASAGDSAGMADPKCMAGIACTTDNPGACAAGHTVCDGNGKSTCMPDVTQQPCYTGEPETTNRGVCHGGMQSCIGTLGACMGQQLPAAAENCYNDVDDDCDGHINDGCPASVTVGDPDPLLARGGTGGNPTSSMCPPGTLVTGVQVQLSANNVSPGYVVSVQPSCATPSLVRGSNAYTVSLAAAESPAPMAGTDAARSGTSRITCAAGGLSAACGVQGSNQGSRNVVESIGVDCAIGTLTLDNMNKLSLSWAKDDANSGVASVQVSGTTWNDTCGNNEVLIGFQGRTGAQMDQVQGICAPLVINYK